MLLVGGLFYLDRYKNELIAAELESLSIRAEMVAAAIGEGAVIDNGIGAARTVAAAGRARWCAVCRRPARVRARLFDQQGDAVGRQPPVLSANLAVQVEDLPTPDQELVRQHRFAASTTSSPARMLADERLPLYLDASRSPAPPTSRSGAGPGRRRRLGDAHDPQPPAASVDRGAGATLQAGAGRASWCRPPARTSSSSLFKVRLTIFQAFAFALTITIILSLYLAGTIARPIRRLAAAADRVRRGRGRRHTIPDLTARGDEIGDLSRRPARHDGSAVAAHGRHRSLRRRRRPRDQEPSDVAAQRRRDGDPRPEPRPPAQTDVDHPR